LDSVVVFSSAGGLLPAVLIVLVIDASVSSNFSNRYSCTFSLILTKLGMIYVPNCKKTVELVSKVLILKFLAIFFLILNLELVSGTA